jgi:molybdopterin-guanine dinucleotide biosynthesis protein A
VGFVVEKFPFGSEIVFNRSGPVVGVSEGFNASANNGIFFVKIDSTLPDNFADIFRGSDI